MHCPRCGRQTAYPDRIGNMRVLPRDVPKDTPFAINRDGTCYTCREAEKGGRVRNRRRREPTEREVWATRQALEAMWRSRRRRGIPPEGIDTGPLLLQLQGVTMVRAVTPKNAGGPGDTKPRSLTSTNTIRNSQEKHHR